jgi:hypothetical protein
VESELGEKIAGILSLNEAQDSNVVRLSPVT